jgi:hypothetical protein
MVADLLAVSGPENGLRRCSLRCEATMAYIGTPARITPAREGTRSMHGVVVASWGLRCRFTPPPVSLACSCRGA